MFRQRIMPKRACWWWTKSARRKRFKGEKNQGRPPLSRLSVARPCVLLTCLAGCVRVAPNHGPVNKVTDANREGNHADRGDRPNVAIRLDSRNQSKSSNVADGSADQQNASAPRTRRLVQFRLQRNVDSARNRRAP